MKHTLKMKPGIVYQVATDELQPDSDQPRKAFQPKRLQELADNIKARGIRQPITVLQCHGKVIIKTGERRWRAAKLAGLETVPCLLEAPENDAPIDVLFDQLSENDLREDLNPMERAAALARLQQDKLGPTEISEQLARHGIHMARSTVSNLLRLNALPDGVKELVRSGALKESYARDLLPVVGPEITPKIVNAVCKRLAKKDEISRHDFAVAFEESLYSHATRIGFNDHCSKKCSCYVTVQGRWNKSSWCLNKKALAAKRAAAEEKKAAKQAAAKAKEEAAVETDPTKAKPVKVKINEAGIVATNRLDWRKYNELRKDWPDFDQAPCQGCPHNHLASDDGKAPADPTCFYPPCFENLKRQATRIRNRKDKIRDMLDEQMLPELVKAAAAKPVAEELLVPLLAFHAGTRAGDHYCFGGGLSELPALLKRGRLNDYLERPPQVNEADVCTIVARMISALPRQWRHELALYLSMNCGDWWQTTEAFAKLFTKAELKDMLPGFDPPDVPVGEWRQRLMNEVKTPAIVAEVWLEDWVGLALNDFDESVDRCRVCGCTEFEACPDGCEWVEAPDENGLGLCSNCVDEEQAAA